MSDHTITDIADIRSYIFGCSRQAVFTLEFAKTGARFTYRVRFYRVWRESSRFFSAEILTGPENESDYAFVGALSDSHTPQGRRWAFHYSPQSNLDDQHPAIVALDWFSKRINYRKPLNPAKVEFWRSGRCSRCGRLLTTPESLQRGMGSKCAEKARGGF